MKQVNASVEGINPTLLGVPQRWIDTPPTPGKMPQRFNARNSSTWERCVQAVDSNDSPHAQWSSAVQMYVRECTRLGLDAFTTELDRADNEAIRIYLQTARLALNAWLDKKRLLELLLVEKVWHEVEFREEQGFVVHTYARCAPQSTLAELETFLRKGCHFFMVPGGGGKILRGYPRPDIQFEAKLINSSYVRLHYEVTVTRPIFHPKIDKGEYIPLGELKEWVKRTFWMPIARGFKPRYSLRKTSF